MSIPMYATCAMCANASETKMEINTYTCARYEQMVLEAIEAACLPKPASMRISIPWNAKPPCDCKGWQPNDKEREFQETDPNAGIVTPPADPEKWARTCGRGW